VLPALLKKIHIAKTENAPLVEVWGTGTPKREFLHVDDLAEACYFLMMNYNEEEFVNIGVGEDISIKDLALLIKEIVGYPGDLKFDSLKPDGTPRKLMDVSRLHALGWKHKISLQEGIQKVYHEVNKELTQA
jgi:GDP-L-fucose synthase